MYNPDIKDLADALYDIGYSDGRYEMPHDAREKDEWKNVVSMLNVGDNYRIAFLEWYDKTEFIQKMDASGQLGYRHLGWHRADIMKELIDKYFGLKESVNYVLDTFKADELAGFRSADRQFAISMLEFAIKN